MAGLLVILLALAAALGTASAISVTFVAHYPADKLPGSTLCLRGDTEPLCWTRGVKMGFIGDNSWTATVDFKYSTLMGVKVLIDDKTWQLGANENVNVTESSTVHLYPWFFTSVGLYEYIRNVCSPQLNNTRDLVLFLPASFSENPLKVTSERAPERETSQSDL